MKLLTFVLLLSCLALTVGAAPITIGTNVEGTAGAATGATAVALPETGLNKQIMVSNLCNDILRVKIGVSTGSDASDNTTGGTRISLPPGSVQVFTLKSTDTHVYLYAAANCAYSFMVGEGS